MKCFLEFLNNNDGIIAFFILIASLISAIAAGIIAFATRRYTNYSRKNYEELKKQNEFLKEKSEEEYKLKRKSISKRLLYEITENEQALKYLFIFFNSKPDSFVKIWDYFEKRKHKNLFKDNIHKLFIRSNIDFREDKIFENLYYLDSFYKKIQHNMNFLMSKDDHLKLQTLDLFLADTLSPIKQSLKKVEELYELFKNETGYDHKKSDFYNETQDLIKILEMQEF